MFNNDAKYAASRIVNTYLPLKENNELVYIANLICAKDNSLDKSTIIGYDRKGRMEVNLSINDFKFSVGKLGYVNSEYEGASYLVRIPLRRDYKQGLRANQLGLQRNTSLSSISSDWLTDNSAKISDCLAGKYNTVDNIIELVEEVDHDIAFSKNFAISEKYNLLYKGFTVGKVTKDDKLKLDFKFNFLEQELAKVAGNEKISI
jgi:hypothetical protein